MKTIYSVSVIAAALLFFASCQKENLVSDNQQPVLRTVTASFENSGTKTTLGENDKPLWKEGDIIRVFGTRTEGNQYDDITLAAVDINNSGKSITFTTTLSGTLYAVYPASATTMTSCSGSIDFTIPAVQDGTFASANICVAKSSATDGTNKDNLVFSNATSVLEFSQTASYTQVLRVAVTAASAIAGKLTASFGTDNKATISTDGLMGKIIYTTAPTTAQDKYYVAVAPVTTGDVNFKYYTALTEASGSQSSATLAKNTIYTLSIPDSGYENSYVEITMTVGGTQKIYKWAKCNIGATKETDYGDYYAWGTTVKAYSAVDYSKRTGAFTFVSSNPYGDDIYKNSWDASKGYDWVNTPFTNGVYSSSNRKVFTKYVPESKKTDYGDGGTFYDGETVLDLADDAANANWGGSWRMPTKEEFDALLSLGKEWKTNYNNLGVNGYLFTDTNNNSIFLPAAGYGDGTRLLDAGDNGRYWSSSLGAGHPSYACYFSIHDGNANTNPVYRYFGNPVRALSE